MRTIKFSSKLFYLIIPAILIITVPLHVKASQYRFSKAEKSLLMGVLEESGFKKDYLETVIHDNRLRRIPVLVTRNVHNKENPRNYENFYNAYSIKIAKRFSRKWRTTLHRASTKFEVDKEVLVAILLIETGFGNILGRYPVISVFSSIIVEHDSKKKQLGKKLKLNEEEAYVLRRLTKKSEWAKGELSALLKISQKTSQNPFGFKGSYAGAFGIPQFLPSSYLKWGYDSDKNGFVNLFLFPDAIYSTANYLKAHGWKKGLYRESNKDVIYTYNRSDVYVEAVLKVAKKIKDIKIPEYQNSSRQTGLYPEGRITKKGSTS